MQSLNILFAFAGTLDAGCCRLRRADVRGSHLLAVRNGKIGQCLSSKLKGCVPYRAKVVKPLSDAASSVPLEELCIALWVLPPQDERHLRAPKSAHNLGMQLCVHSSMICMLVAVGWERVHNCPFRALQCELELGLQDCSQRRCIVRCMLSRQTWSACAWHRPQRSLWQAGLLRLGDLRGFGSRSSSACTASPFSAAGMGRNAASLMSHVHSSSL